MAQIEVELILIRHLAEYLAVPVFIVDPEGTLLFYNEPAESILGRRFEEAGEMPASEWSTVFNATDESGAPIPPEQLPLMIAQTEHRPAHGSHWIWGLDGARHSIEVTALPLVGIAGRAVGAVAIFWESARPEREVQGWKVTAAPKRASNPQAGQAGAGT
jgi:PAS domain-containing protein